MADTWFTQNAPTGGTAALLQSTARRGNATSVLGSTVAGAGYGALAGSFMGGIGIGPGIGAATGATYGAMYGLAKKWGSNSEQHKTTDIAYADARNLIAQAFRESMGREPTDQEITNEIGTPQMGEWVNQNRYASAIQKIQSYPEAQAYKASGVAAGAAGTGSSTLGSTMGAGAGMTPEDVMKLDPGFKFRLGEGLQAIERSAAAKGTLLTGGTMKDLVQYGQGFASNEYSKIFDRYSSMADRALNASNMQADTGSWYGGNSMNNTTNMGNVAAAGQVASGNAMQAGVTGAINTGLDWWTQYQKDKAKTTTIPSFAKSNAGNDTGTFG